MKTIKLIFAFLLLMLSVISYSLPFIAIFMTGNWWFILLFFVSWIPGCMFAAIGIAVFED